MSKKETQFNVGDKFILTISEKYAPTGTESARQDSPETLYRMNGFKSLVFDAEGLRKLKRYEPQKPIDIEAIRDDAFYNGAREAWELACTIGKGEISSSDLRKIFDTGLTNIIFACYSFTEARDRFETFLAKKKAKEEKKRGADALKPGDIVRNVATGALAVVASEPNGGGVTVVERGGLFHALTIEYKKVGTNALEAIGVKSDA